MNEFLQSVRENLVFILTCLAIFAALALIAKLAEKLMKMPNRLSVREATLSPIPSLEIA